MLAACNKPDIEPNTAIRAPQPLSLISEISGAGEFHPSGVAGLPNCGVVLVGAQWGTVVYIGNDGRSTSKEIKLPGFRSTTRLETNQQNGEVLAWSLHPVLAASLDTEGAGIDTAVVLKHRWGGSRMGPAAPLLNGDYAVAPLSTRDAPVRRPSPRATAPLIHVAHHDGTEYASVGELPDTSGLYLPSLLSTMTLGSYADTIRAVTHSDAIVRTYVRDTATGQYLEHSTVALPRYFDSPPVKERVFTYPWIQVSGDVTQFEHVPHIATATFGSEGRLYAVRNYSAHWLKFPSPFFPQGGLWVPNARALEVYDVNGKLLGSYFIPKINIHWLRADRNGRLFIRDSVPRILVVDDPASKAKACAPLPATVKIDVKETP